MARQRSYTSGLNHRLRSDKPFYQASDSEIISDLKRLDFPIAPKKTTEEIVIHETPLPKKRVAPAEDIEYVIDGLVKLMTTKIKEVKKKASPPVIVEKKPELPMQTLSQQYFAMLPYLNFTNQFLMNDPRMMQGSFPFSAFPYQIPVQITSSANMHLKIARYIQTQKINC